MSLMILKHSLFDEETQEIEVPRTSRTLSVQLQGRNLCLWREGNPASGVRTLTIDIFKTGRPFEYLPRTFLATIVFQDSVWHVYERT